MVHKPTIKRSEGEQMADFQPNAAVVVGGPPGFFGFRESPPFVVWAVAERWNAESDAKKKKGRYKQDKKRTEGAMDRKRIDTSLSTGRNTGFIFVPESGTWADDWVDPITNTYGLLIQDATPGVLYQATSQDNLTPSIEPAEIVIGRGFPGLSPGGTGYAAAECFTSLTWGIGLSYQYQLTFMYGRPLMLQFSKDSGATWFPHAENRSLPNLEQMLQQNGNRLRLNVSLDHSERLLNIEFADGRHLSHGLPLDLKGSMNAPAKFRIQHRNGWLHFTYAPLRHGPAEMTSAKFDRGVAYPTLDHAVVKLNTLDGSPTDQTDTGSVVVSDTGFHVEMSASRPDAGDGLGSKNAPILTDVEVTMPALWTNEVGGIVDLRTATLQPQVITEHQHFDPITRLFRSEAIIQALNEDGSLNDLIGALAVELDMSNGGALRRRMTGIAEGPIYSRSDPIRLFTLHVADKLVYLQEQLGQEVTFDGWCIWSVFRFLCEVAGIHPQWLTFLPLYIPPGKTEEAPYGQAGIDCPYPVLARGTGGAPKYRYYPEAVCMAILQEVLQDISEVDPVFGTPAPYVCGADPEGNVLIFPYFISDLPVKHVYSDIDPSGQGLISGQIQWSVDTSSLRTNLTLQGLDPFTAEFLHVWKTMPDQVRALVGRPRDMIDRSVRYQSLPQMAEVMDALSVPASLPVMVGDFTAPFQGHVFAGDMVQVFDSHHPEFAGNYIVEDSLVQEGYVGANATVLEAQLRVRSVTGYLRRTRAADDPERARSEGRRVRHTSRVPRGESPRSPFRKAA